MKKENFPGITKNVKELKDQATRLGKEAVKTVDGLKGAIQTGVSTSKSIFERASSVAGKLLNKKGFSRGLEATSKGVDAVAKGARLAHKGVGTVADSMEKASGRIQKMKEKLKDSPKK